MPDRGRVRNYDDLAARIDDPILPVTADSVLVLQNAGPLGGPGMPEWGMLPIPKKLLAAGRPRHGAFVRCSHERHQLRCLRPPYCAGVIHRRAAAFVRDGDIIELDVPARKLSIQLDDAELARRRAEWKPPGGRSIRAVRTDVFLHVAGRFADCDFDFWKARRRLRSRRFMISVASFQVSSLQCGKP
jgi:dihydroxy-acid dehydratase